MKEYNINRDIGSFVILCLSITTSFFSLIARLYKWHHSTPPLDTASKLILCLTISGMIYIFVNVYKIKDLLGAIGWLVLKKYDICPTFMAISYIGYLSACFCTNSIGML